VLSFIVNAGAKEIHVYHKEYADAEYIIVGNMRFRAAIDSIGNMFM
jgi:hypothetical protein